jgi:hypothetical protein
VTIAAQPIGLIQEALKQVLEQDPPMVEAA